MLRSMYWAHKKDHERALADANQAIAVDPKSCEAYVARAFAWYKSDDVDHALADCDAAIRLSSDEKSAHALRAVLLAGKAELGAAFGEWLFHPSPIKFTFKF
jgi:regulator of sirC expression with transglutaminase-like and TPR domain